MIRISVRGLVAWVAVAAVLGYGAMLVHVLLS